MCCLSWGGYSDLSRHFKYHNPSLLFELGDTISRISKLKSNKEQNLLQLLDGRRWKLYSYTGQNSSRLHFIVVLLIVSADGGPVSSAVVRVVLQHCVMIRDLQADAQICGAVSHEMGSARTYIILCGTGLIKMRAEAVWWSWWI